MHKRISLLYFKIAAFFVAKLCLLMPLLANAQYANKESLQGYIVLILGFINYIILPLIFSIALLFFLVNAARYFIIEGGDQDGREKAKTLALYGIGAFVILVSIWGVVNMFVYGLGIANDEALCPDYLGNWCSQGSNDGYFNDSFINFEFNASITI